MSESAIKRWWNKPPALFPWVALFHLFITGHAIYTFIGEPLEAWAYPLSFVLYTILWFFVCGLHRWAAWGYIALTSVNLLLHYYLVNSGGWYAFSGAMSLIDVLFSFFILVFYRRFS
ncbi:MAG: hypothetical protein EOP56_08520 [Sphingobacteriales bacterium]|nr:MAG: hypothetical protein EOP56_08520 [Sphingobacteriales bacterium]